MKFCRKAAAAAISGLLLLSYYNLSSASEVDLSALSCPTNSMAETRKKDYRLRESTAKLKWNLNDNYENHLRPALRRMESGDFSTPVIDDLHFTLERWPNHYPALQAIVTYEAGGGRANKYIPVSCYFQRANRFAPNDANILVLHGIYEHKKGHDDLAEQSWMRALQIDDNAVEAHYNLGLLYFRQKRFSESVEHAQLAYELGYPLPGLKTNLKKQGYWEGND